MVRRTKSDTKALDKAVAKLWKPGQYMTQKGLTKLNAKLRNQGFSPITNWINYRRARLERSRKALDAKGKTSKVKDARAVMKLIRGRNRLTAAARTVACYIVGRYCAGAYANVRFGTKRGQLTKADYTTFMKQKLHMPLKVSGEQERVSRWTAVFGCHLDKHVTVSTLFGLAQLHAVEPQVPRWDFIGDSLLGKTLYMQSRLRGTEISQRWRDHGLPHNQAADGVAHTLDREHFRQTFRATWFTRPVPLTPHVYARARETPGFSPLSYFCTSSQPFTSPFQLRATPGKLQSSQPRVSVSLAEITT